MSSNPLAYSGSSSGYPMLQPLGEASQYSSASSQSKNFIQKFLIFCLMFDWSLQCTISIHHTFIKWQTKRLLVNHRQNRQTTQVLRFQMLRIRFTVQQRPLIIIITITRLRVSINSQLQTLVTRHLKMSTKTDRWTAMKAPTRLINSPASTTITTFSCRRPQTVWSQQTWVQRQETATATVKLPTQSTVKHRRRKMRWSLRTTTIIRHGVQAPVIISFRCPTHHRFIPVPIAQPITHRLRFTAPITIYRPLWSRIKIFPGFHIHTAERASECRSRFILGINELLERSTRE